jgi:hypothetical protein
MNDCTVRESNSPIQFVSQGVIDLSFQGYGWSEARQPVLLDLDATRVLMEAMRAFITKQIDDGRGWIGPYESWLESELDRISCMLQESPA